MRSSGISPVCSTFGVGALLLAGCSNPQSMTGVAGPANALPATATSRIAALHARSHSWMLPEAKKAHTLLYVTDNFEGNVFVLRYPNIKLVGTLTGFYDLNGICSDSKGNVWIPELDDVLEYAHGGTTPITTLDDSNQFGEDCSVNPKTGDLAVMNYSATNSTTGSVLVFPQAQGSPQTYTDPQMYYYYSVAYDNAGNLYVDGTVAQSGGFQFAQLSAGASSFTNYALNLPYSWPGGVAWDGQYITVEDANSGTVYQLTLSGSDVTKVGSTSLNGLRDITQYFIPLKHPKKTHQGTQLIAAGSETPAIGVYNYPAGGSPIETIGSYGNPFVAPEGATLSYK
jgi:hypothetical protein